MKEKIAIVVDSGSDVSGVLKERLDIYSLPLRVIIDGKEFTDGVDITAKQVYDSLDTSKVTSSLPSGHDITRQFEALKADGYTHVVAIAISTGLSGTYNVIRNLKDSVDGLVVHVIDTKNISLGSGFNAIEAARLVAQGKSFAEIVTHIEATLERSKVYFTVGTLDYLRRGGRIGLVAGTVANVLNIKPVISCNEDGVYHTLTKVRGYGRVIRKMIDIAAEFANQVESFRVVVLNADTKEDINEILEYARSVMPKATKIELSNIAPALGIHTGPEALGIGIYQNN